jgi:hypothetical protein
MAAGQQSEPRERILLAQKMETPAGRTLRAKRFTASCPAGYRAAI